MIYDRMTKGVEYQIGWTFKIDSTTPKNITDYNVLVQIRSNKNSDIVLAEFNNQSEELLIDAIEGKVDLFISPLTVDSYNFSSSVLDCWIYNNEDTDGDRSQTVHLSYEKGVSRN